MHVQHTTSIGDDRESSFAKNRARAVCHFFLPPLRCNMASEQLPVADAQNVTIETMANIFLPDMDDDSDPTGDREWDSGRLLLTVLTDTDACKLLQLPDVALPPGEVLELGAGTGVMACSLALQWPGVCYVATDLPCRLAAIKANAISGKCTNLRAEPLYWGEDPPASTCEKATYVILMADLIYFHGKNLLEPDTLEPLAHTLHLALSRHPRAFAIFTFRERDPEREAHFRSLCVAHDLSISEPLNKERLEALLPTNMHSDVESSGPLKLWCLSCETWSRSADKAGDGLV